jgi:hypothetical protein
MRSFRIVACAVAACTIAALPLFAEDLTIVSKVDGPKGPQTATTYLTADRMRTTEGDSDFIMDFAGGKIVTVNNAKKEYSESTFVEIQAAMDRAGAKMKQMQEQMKSNPQAAKMMEKMMGGALGEVTVTKGTGSRTIAGYSCEPYTLRMGESMTVEMWTSAALQPPTQYFEARKLLFPGGGPMADRLGKMFDEMKKVKGYPLSETTSFAMMGKEMKSSREATAVTKGAIPATTFAVPAGYKKVESPYAAMMKK